MNRTLFRTALLGSSLALALAVGVAWPVNARAADPLKGAQKMIELKPIKSVQDIEALEPGDAVVMSCPKCKTVTVTYVETTKGHITEEKVKQQHLCPGCGTKVETTGAGKSARHEVTHVCQKCGTKDVMCCVMKKGSGPTKGMDEKK